MYHNPLVRTSFILTSILIFCLAFVACEDSEAPVLPSEMAIESGNLQWSKRTTGLPDPLVVRVTFSDGSGAVGYRVLFELGDLGGTLSSVSVNTNQFGLASTRLTLPDQVGTARVRAYLADDPAVFADFSATSSDFYCPQEDPTFVRKFSSDGVVFNDLFLFTRTSNLFGGAGIIRVTPGQGVYSARTFKSFGEDAFRKVVRDAAFSASGDFFLAWTYQRLETARVNSDPGEDVEGFSRLVSYYGSEIFPTPAGILVGCDEYGPFTIGCRDTLARFEEASYAGRDAGDEASGDAVAVDIDTEDIYYIHLQSQTLKRLPVDNMIATGAPEDVAALTVDEAYGASGMVVDNGDVFILVDTDDTRSIVKVTSGGTKTTEVDFFSARGAGDAAGRQNDLAIDRQYRFLYTVDRLNDVLLLYEIVQKQLRVLTANPADTDPESLSRAGVSDERIGLAVVPRSGL